MENFHMDALLWVPEVILIRRTSTVYHHHLLRSGALLPLSTASKLCWWRRCRLLSKHIITMHTMLRRQRSDRVTLHHWIPHGPLIVSILQHTNLRKYIHLFDMHIHAEWENCQHISEPYVSMWSATVYHQNPSRRLMVDKMFLYFKALQYTD